MPEATGYVAVEGGDSRVEVVPSEGGRVRSLHLFGREWLMERDEGGGERPVDGPLMSGAGWEECTPAAGAGPVPDWVKGVGGRANPAGGEARAMHPETSVATEAGAHRVTSIWRGEKMPWVLTRTLLVRQDGAVEARYEALTTGRERLPFLWSANILVPLASETRLQLSEGTRLRTESVRGVTASSDITEVDAQWPRLTLDGRQRDLGKPWDLPRATTYTGWLDLGAGRAMLQLWQGEERLTLTCDGAGVPYCGIVIDRGGNETTGRRGMFGRAAKGLPAIAIRPSLGAPDRYVDALGKWKSMTWLAPGEPRRWTMTLRGGS